MIFYLIFLSLLAFGFSDSFSQNHHLSNDPYFDLAYVKPKGNFSSKITNTFERTNYFTTAPPVYANETSIQDLFGLYTYPPSAYKQYIGLDYTALFSSAISINEKFAIVGSNGYSKFVRAQIKINSSNVFFRYFRRNSPCLHSCLIVRVDTTKLYSLSTCRQCKFRCQCGN